MYIYVYIYIYIARERERGTENHLEPLHELIFTCADLHTACHMQDQSLHLPCRTHSFQSPAAHNPAVHWIPNRARSGAPPVLHPKFHRSLIDGLCSCQRGQWRVSEHVHPPPEAKTFSAQASSTSLVVGINSDTHIYVYIDTNVNIDIDMDMDAHMYCMDMHAHMYVCR